MKLLMLLAAAAVLPVLHGCAAQQPSEGAQSFGLMRVGATRKGALRSEQRAARADADRPQGADAQEIAQQDAAVETALQRAPAAASEDAKDLMAKGKAYVAQARSADDYSAAVSAMKRAVSLA